MSRRSRIAIVFVALAIAWGSPGEASAGVGGFWDWIHKLSGPRMEGFGVFGEACVSKFLFSPSNDEDEKRCSDAKVDIPRPGVQLGDGESIDVYMQAHISKTTGQDENVEGVDVVRYASGVSAQVLFGPAQKKFDSGLSVKLVAGAGYTGHRFSGNEFDNFTRHSAEVNGGVRWVFGNSLLYLDTVFRGIYFPTAINAEDFGGAPDPAAETSEFAVGALLIGGFRF